jgi:hypothetical protein
MSVLHATRLAVLSASLIVGLTLAGCSSDAAWDDDVSRTRMGASDVLGTDLQVRTSVSRVIGRLAASQRERLERDAGRLLGDYLAAAYLHDRPSAGHRDSFPGFTAGARELALEDVGTTSDAAFSAADEVRSRGAVAFLSVVASEGRAVGATARVFLDLTVVEGDRSRLVEVQGRLLLSPAGRGWRIFGYDLSLDTSPAKRGDR